MPVPQPTADRSGAFWVTVTNLHREPLEPRFYSSHDSEADAQALADQQNGLEKSRVIQARANNDMTVQVQVTYTVIPKPE